MSGPLITRAPLLQRLRDGLGTGVVESHTVDQRALIHGAKHARWIITRLRVLGDAAQFGKAESQPFPHGHSGCVLIHPGSEPDGIREAQAA